MKKFITLFTVALLLSASLSSCGNAEAEKKAAEEREAARVDSVNKELEKVQQEEKAKQEELRKSLEDLNAGTESK